jgi:hypothetical protein
MNSFFGKAIGLTKYEIIENVDYFNILTKIKKYNIRNYDNERKRYLNKVRKDLRSIKIRLNKIDSPKAKILRSLLEIEHLLIDSIKYTFSDRRSILNNKLNSELSKLKTLKISDYYHIIFKDNMFIVKSSNFELYFMGFSLYVGNVNFNRFFGGQNKVDYNLGYPQNNTLETLLKLIKEII